jgi:ParB/RepB/Spo0J family partition protein
MDLIHHVIAADPDYLPDLGARGPVRFIPTPERKHPTMTVTPIRAAKSSRAALELLEIDPTTLGIRDQARADATPDDELIASVRQFGIMQPPTVEYDTTEDRHYILMGHRRVGAAIAAGLNPITVILRPDALADEAITLERQIVENERRKALTAAEVTQGYKKLELFGRTPEDIAAELGEKPEKVRAGLKINRSAAASQLVAEEPSIDFEQAAVIAEFDEHPKLQQKLIDTATTNPANFQRDVENSRTQREVDSRIAKLKEQLDADNIPLADVTTYEQSWWSGKGVGTGKGRSLDRLGLSIDEHADCPGHAVIIHKAMSYYLKDQPDTWLLYVCTDWEGNGHAGTAAAAPKTPEEIQREEERIARQAEYERQQDERAARRQLIDANTRARRTWLHGYLTTGRLRPTAAHFDVMAEAFSLQMASSEWAPIHITLELLTGEDVAPVYHDDTNELALTALIDDPSIPNLRVIVATAIATFEDGLETPQAVKYFEALQSWGYTLTDTDREHLAEAEAAVARSIAGPDDSADEDADDE